MALSKNLKLLASALLVLSLLSVLAIQAHAKKTSSVEVSLDQFLSSLQKTKGLKAALTKTTRLELLDREEVQEGTLYLKPGAIRIEFKEPTENIAVISQTNFWTIEYPPKNSKEPVRVLKGELDKKSAANLLLHNVLAQGKWRGLLKPKKRIDGEKEVNFEMLSDGPLKLQLKQVNLIFDKKSKQLKNLIYVDELGNRTDLLLKDIQFDVKLDSQLFTYNPPKNAEITEL